MSKHKDALRHQFEREIREGAIDLSSLRGGHISDLAAAIIPDPDNPGYFTVRPDRGVASPTTTGDVTGSPAPASDPVPSKHQPALRPVPRWRARLASALRELAALLTREAGNSES